MSFNRELIGVYLSTDNVFDNGPDRRCIIGTVRLPDGKTMQVKGYAREDQTEEGVTYRFFGRPQTHHRYGLQFHFNSLVEEQPADEDSIIAYLETCRKPERGSITPRVALALYEAFGAEAIDKVISDPVGASAAVKKWDADKAGLASSYLRSKDRTRRCTLDLITMMQGRGFPKKTPDRAIQEWGCEAAAVIREDPYALLALPGIGFRGADKLYCDLSREMATSDQDYHDRLAAIRRQGLCAAHEAAIDHSGSTWLPAGQLKGAVTRAIGNTRALPDEALAWAVMEGRLTHRNGFYALSRRATDEMDVAWYAVETVDDPDPHSWPDISEIVLCEPDGKPLSSHQIEAIRTALSARMCCLQGSPGVGKTFVVACIVKALEQLYGRDAIAVAAPTGKAGVRVGQSLIANGVDLPTSTIHRLLGVESSDKGGWNFVCNAQNPLPFRFIVVDEASMIETGLMASLLAACTGTTHLLFVGDTNQLAPVGHGKPFCDLQQVVPTGHLTEIRRNSGRIVRECARIRDHRRVEFSPKLDLPNGENMPLIQADGPDQVSAMESLVRQLSDRDINPIDDLQILTAKNDASLVARKPLNKLLQGLQNPDGQSVHGNPFRVGDKIVCIRNGTYPDAEDQHETKHFVANGELGRVVALAPGRMEVSLSDPARRIFVTHAPITEQESSVADSEDAAQRGAVGDWDLGYCLSVHRSQGSQWKYVIVMADPAGAMVQTRNWLYTAISRAEIATYVIGQTGVVNQMLRRDGIVGRKTMLAEQVMELRLSRVIDHEEIWGEV